MIFKIWLFYMHERKVLYILYISMHVLRSPQRSGRPACHIFFSWVQWVLWIFTVFFSVYQNTFRWRIITWEKSVQVILIFYRNDRVRYSNNSLLRGEQLRMPTCTTSCEFAPRWEPTTCWRLPYSLSSP